jgi:mannose-6-phosphate isomerase-like protein (cupin superfamily)
VTKRIVLAALVSAAAGAAMAAEGVGIVVWPASDLKAYREKLAPKMNEKKLSLEQLGTFGNHSTLIAHREGDGESEVHDVQADFFVVQTGNATLVLGGEVVGGKTTAPGEIRGSSIKGGQRHALAAGDVVHIPAKVPHQLLVAPGKEFTYFVIKIDTP